VGVLPPTTPNYPNYPALLPRCLSGASGEEDVNKSLYPVVLRGEQLPLKKGDNFL